MECGTSLFPGFLRDSGSICALLFNSSGMIVSANDFFLKLYGYDSVSGVEQKLIFHSEDIPVLNEALIDCKRIGSGSSSRILRLFSLSHSTYGIGPWEFSPYESIGFTGVLAVSGSGFRPYIAPKDFSDSLIHDENLQIKNQLSLLILDKDFWIEEIRGITFSIFGLSPDTLIGKKLDAIIPPSDLQRFEAFLQDEEVSAFELYDFHVSRWIGLFVERTFEGYRMLVRDITLSVHQRLVKELKQLFLRSSFVGVDFREVILELRLKMQAVFPEMNPVALFCQDFEEKKFEVLADLDLNETLADVSADYFMDLVPVRDIRDIKKNVRVIEDLSEEGYLSGILNSGGQSFKSLWAFPFCEQSGHCLGIFLMFFKNPVRASAEELDFLIQVNETFHILLDFLATKKNLLSTEKDFQLLVENSQNLIFKVSSEGEVVFVSPRWEDELQYSKHEIIGRQFLSFIHPGDIEKVYGQIKQAMEGEGKIHDLEARILRKDGGQIWFKFKVKLILDGQGKLKEVMGTAANIHHLKTLADQLRVERDFFRMVIDHLPIILAVKDRGGFFQLGNQTLADYYGISVLDFEGKKDEDFAQVAEEAENFRKDDLAVFESKQSILIEEEPISLANKERRWLKTRKIPLLDDTGEVKQVLVLAEDITEVKAAKDELWKKDQLLSSVMATQQEMLCRFLPDTTLLFVNEAFSRTFGVPVEELVGLRILDISPADLSTEVIELLSKINQENPHYTQLYLIGLKEGREAWQEWSYTGVFDGQGQMLEVQATGREVTDRILAEKALRESEALFRSVFEGNAYPIWLVSKSSGKVVDVNPTFLEQYGYAKDLVVGKDHKGFFSDSLLLQERDKCLKGNKRFFGHLQLIAADGQLKDTEAFASVIGRNDEELIFEILLDMTESLRQQRKAERQDKVLDDIAWVQSHVVRAPLAKILGICNLIKSEELGQDELNYWLSQLYKVSLEMDKAIRDVAKLTDKAKREREV